MFVLPVVARLLTRFGGAFLIVAVIAISAASQAVAARPVALVSADPSRWHFARQIMEGTTNSGGLVSFNCAPGEYLLIVSGSEGSWPPQPAMIQERSATAPHIKVTSGGSHSVTIPVLGVDR